MGQNNGGRFQPGHPAFSNGRPAGASNRMTNKVRGAIVAAAELHGRDGNGEGGLVGYLFFLAARHPKAFSSLIGRVLPLEIAGEVNVGGNHHVTVVAVPNDRYLTPEDVRRLVPDFDKPVREPELVVAPDDDDPIH